MLVMLEEMLKERECITHDLVSDVNVEYLHSVLILTM